ncbi:MAG: GNAT family N-acetyltransferase [Pseudomonadota bacterium]
MSAKAKTEINSGFRPGSIGQIIDMHGRYYARAWDMGLAFEIGVANGLTVFAERYDAKTDLVLLGLQGERIVASLIVDANDPDGDRWIQGMPRAHLRYFIRDESARGGGIGSMMMKQAMDHVDAHCAGRCWLTTFAGLDAARTLYERHGFSLTHEEAGTTWARALTEQVFVRDT